jgi:hypothetical protein
MELAPKHNYVYEKCENGWKGGLCMEGGNSLAHLSVPIGVIVIREQSSTMPHHHYEEFENTDYNTIEDELFDKMLDRCSQHLRNHKETRKKTHKTKSNVSKKK